MVWPAMSTRSQRWLREAARLGGMRQTAGLTGLPGIKTQVRRVRQRRRFGLWRGPTPTTAPADPSSGAAGRKEHFRARGHGRATVWRCWGRSTPPEPVMPKDHDFKRLVRARMGRTGERYTQARAVLTAERGSPDPLVSDRTRSVLSQLADIELAEASRRYLEQLPESQRRAAAIEGLDH